MYYYGKFNQRLNNEEKAQKIFKQIILLSKGVPKFSKKFTRKWASLAAKEMKEMNNAT